MWGYCFEKLTKENPWMVLNIPSNEMNGSMYHSILIQWYLFQDINEYLISVLFTSTIKPEVIKIRKWYGY